MLVCSLYTSLDSSRSSERTLPDGIHTLMYNLTLACTEKCMCWSLVVISESSDMHGLPCSSLDQCFGHPSDANTGPSPAAEPNNSILNRNNNGVPAATPVLSQPRTISSSPLEIQHKPLQRTFSFVSSCSTTSRNLISTHSNSKCYIQEEDQGEDQSPAPSPLVRNLSGRSGDGCPEVELKPPQIPRPSIIRSAAMVRRLFESLTV